MEREDVRLMFISEALHEYFRDVIDAMKSTIAAKNAIDTKSLFNSLTYRLYQQYADGNGNLSFAEWGRFLDMGVGRGNPLGGIKATTKALHKNKSTNGLKPRKIYGPIAYGHLNGLISRLAYGFTDETINRIKNTLDQKHV